MRTHSATILRSRFAAYMRNFVFGVEDSLVSTVGLLSGVAAAGLPRATILLTGLVLIFVEAISMGIGSFLSERSAGEYLDGPNVGARQSVVDAVIMFVSYLVAGFIPLAPYLLLASNIAFGVSVGLSLVALFLLGAVSARVLGTAIWKSGVRTLALGGLATIVGIVVGNLVQGA